MTGPVVAKHEFSIIDAIHQAVQTNPGVGEAAANRRATETELRQNQGTLLPQVRIDAEIGPQRTDRLALNCDNGRIYPIRVRAVSDAGELVTGYLFTTPRRPHHFRLIPMGTGYRYAGHGFWFDGLRGEATLYVDSREATCTVEYS